MNYQIKILTLSLVIALSTSSESRAASANGTARQVVVAAISITNVSDLDFGTAVQGAAAATVLPGATENSENGSFTVSGQASTAYTITLPANGVVTMTTGGGGANETIAVTNFASFPAAGANGMIGAGGTQLLLVGATRAALGVSQVPGTYTGTYTVDVVY